MSEEKMMVGITNAMLDSILHLMCGGVLECEDNRSSEFDVGEMFKLVRKDNGFELMECSPSVCEYDWQVSDLSVGDLFSMRFTIKSKYRYTFATMIGHLLDDDGAKAYSEFDPDLAYRIEDGLLYHRREGKDDDPDAEWSIASVPKGAMKSGWFVKSTFDILDELSTPPVVE